MANTALRISELDFDTIRTNLKDFLRSQSEFTDYDFEGSGMAVLLDILAYNTHYMGYYLNMIGNEMFLDTAQLRNSVLSHAKLTNYTPKSKTAALATVKIQVTPGISEDQTSTTLTLPKWTRLISESLDGENYIFSTIHANTATKSANTFVFNNIKVKQGDVITHNFLVDSNNPKRRFGIPSANVDSDTLTVTVQVSEANTLTTEYTRSNDITEISSTSEVYFLEENPDGGNYTIYFGDGYLGKQLSNNNIVTVKYLETTGKGNKVNNYTIIESIGSYSSNISVTGLIAAAGGSPKESIEQIRYRAPKHYTAQNRAVTKNDYESLLMRDYPNVESIAIWGGDENDPPVYGKVFLALKPITNYVITEADKLRIKDEIIENRSVLTVFPEFIEPDYTYLITNIQVNYNPNLTGLDEDEIKQLVRQVVLDYRDDKLSTFSSIFRKSQLSKLIDNAEKSILSNTLDLYVQKRLEPTANTTKNYSFSYNMPLHKVSSVKHKFYTYPGVLVLDNDGIEREVFFEETPESFTGVDSIEVLEPGRSYTESPTVTITGDGSGAAGYAKVVNGKVESIEVTSRGSNYTRATATISGGNGTGAVARVILEQSNGTLRTYYFKANGEKVIVDPDAGTIDYINGKVTLSEFTPILVKTNPLYASGILTFNVQPEDETIYTLRNQILDIDQDDSNSIHVMMVPEE